MLNIYWLSFGPFVHMTCFYKGLTVLHLRFKLLALQNVVSATYVSPSHLQGAPHTDALLPMELNSVRDDCFPQCSVCRSSLRHPEKPQQHRQQEAGCSWTRERSARLCRRLWESHHRQCAETLCWIFSTWKRLFCFVRLWENYLQTQKV